MKPLRFKEFLDSQESSAFTRSRHMWLLGLGPDMAPQSIFSRSTADPREVEYGKKKKKKSKKKSTKKKKIKEALEEGKAQPPVNKEVDKWLEAVDKLKRELDGFWDDENEDDKPKPEDLEFDPKEDDEEEEDDFRDLEVGDEEKELTPPEEEPGEEDEINELPPPPPFEPPKFKEWALRQEVAAELGHVGLDALGLIPGIGEGADFTNAAWYMAEAEKSTGREKQWKYFLAAMSIVSMIPDIGDAVGKGVKYLAKSNKHFGQFAFKFGPTVKKYWPKVLQFVKNNDKFKNRAMELDLAVRSLI